MNIAKLKAAEADFLEQYPGGFLHPAMVEIGKKHKMDKLIIRAQEVFQKERFYNTKLVSEDIIKTVTYSSMVSVFEKPKFRDFVRNLQVSALNKLTSAIYQLLHEDMETGFNLLVNLLEPVKLAKWTLVTVCPAYFRPQDEVFIKPTTTKNAITYFELSGLTYKALPTWDFYKRYRSIILKMKKEVSPLLSPDNAAFSGFLMLSMGI